MKLIAKTLSIIYQCSCTTGEVPEDWRLASVTFIYKKSCKEDLRNYRPFSLIPVSEKIMEQIFLEDMLRHMRNEGVIQDS